MKIFIIQKDRSSGFALLASVLIISALALMLTVAMVLGDTDWRRASDLQAAQVQAEAWSLSCADAALAAISVSSTSVLPGSLSGTYGSCSYEIIDSGGISRLIQSTGVSGPANSRRRLELDQIAPPHIQYEATVASF